MEGVNLRGKNLIVISCVLLTVGLIIASLDFKSKPLTISGIEEVEVGEEATFTVTFENEPVEDAIIKVGNQTKATDANGTATFVFDDPGNFTVTAFKEGHENSSFLIIVSPSTSGREGKIIPPEYGCYVGVFPGWGEYEDSVSAQQLEDFEELSGKSVAISSFSNFWGESYVSSQQLDEIVGYGAIPLLRMMPWGEPYWEPGYQSDYALQRIIDGDFDQFLSDWADAIKDFGKPVMVTFGCEMNGDWFPWSGIFQGGSTANGFGDPNKADGPKRYVAAYRHIIELFRGKGVNNIAWLFHPNAQSYPEEEWNSIHAYYPGDEYIDWVGVSIYGTQYADESWYSFEALMDPVYNELTSLFPNKPLMISEWGVGEWPHKGDKAAWYTEALTKLQSKYTHVKVAIVYHERWQNDDDTWSDLRVDSSPEALKAYRDGVSSDYFLGKAGSFDSEEQLPLSQIKYWAYQIQELNNPEAFDELANSHYDMLVLEPTRTDWSSDDKHFDTKGMVERLKSTKASDGVHRKLIIAYIDIGEAENWRWYWKWSRDWSQGEPRPSDWPDYILTQDPDGWEGCFPVAYWDDRWKDVIIYGRWQDSSPYGDYSSVIDEVIKDDFDGVYLDWVEGFEDDAVIAEAQRQGKNPAVEMIRFIQEIKDYATERNPNFIIIQQNAATLFEGYPELFSIIDAISQEAIWYDGDAFDEWNAPDGYDVPNDLSLTNYYSEHLDQYKATSVPVFNCEYALNHADDAYSKSYEKGYVPYCTRRALSRLTTTPPPGNDANMQMQ